MPGSVTRAREQNRQEAFDRTRRWHEGAHGWLAEEAEASLRSAFALADLLRAIKADPP